MSENTKKEIDEKELEGVAGGRITEHKSSRADNFSRKDAMSSQKALSHKAASRKDNFIHKIANIFKQA